VTIEDVPAQEEVDDTGRHLDVRRANFSLLSKYKRTNSSEVTMMRGIKDEGFSSNVDFEEVNLDHFEEEFNNPESDYRNLYPLQKSNKIESTYVSKSFSLNLIF